MNRSIIIPNFNRAASLEEVLNALENQVDEQTEVIVVDNGSNDHSKYLCEQYDFVTFLQAVEKQSPYYARNIGMKHAKGAFIILLDATCTPSQHWLKEGMAVLAADPKKLVSGPIVPNLKESHSIFHLADGLSIHDQYQSYVSNDSYPGGHLFFHRSLIDVIGYFPELRSGADIFWTHQAVKHGFSLGYAEKACVTYQTKGKKLFRNKAIRIGKGYWERFCLQKNKTYVFYLLNAIYSLRPPRPDLINHRLKKLNLSISLKQFIGVWWAVWYYRWYRFIGMMSK